MATNLYTHQEENIRKNFLAKKSFSGAFSFVVLFFLSFGFVLAQSQEEAIRDFQSVIEVHTDGRVSVTETIVYDTGPLDRHGIYRDIYPFSSAGKKMRIENISVTDASGRAHDWVRQSQGNYVRLKIGDPDTTFQGEKTYKIEYTATRAVAYLEELDEIYWNVTGNNWLIPVYQASAKVILPEGAEALQSACYSGPTGSTNRCDSISDDTLMSQSILNPGEGMTVAVGFSKGVIEPPTARENILEFFRQYGDWLAGFLIFATVFAALFRKWFLYGRDAKGTEVIVPQYDILDGLSPLEVGGILRETVGGKDISAQIVYLATEGYIKIREIETKVMGIFDKKDYELTLLQEFDTLGGFDKELLSKLFTASSPGSTTRLSDLNNTFYTAIPEIKKKVMATLLTHGYYENIGNTFFQHFGRILGTLGVGAFAAFLLFRSAVIIFSFLFSLILVVFFQFLMPAKSKKGVAAKEYILGLKDYLQIAEKDRLAFHNAPEKRPEVFEKLLPFAMVLGVEKAWAKEFEGIYTAPPSWYEGATGAHFSAISFGDSLAHFNATAVGSLSSAPGGGSGGGGSSGGGGGGGGGGGW